MLYFFIRVLNIQGQKKIVVKRRLLLIYINSYVAQLGFKKSTPPTIQAFGEHDNELLFWNIVLI